MSWATARAALVELLDGQTIVAVDDEGAETMHAHEYPPPGEIGPEQLPVAFVPGPARRWTYLPGGMLQTDIDELTVTVYLGPPNDSAEALEKRRERWVDVLGPLTFANQTLGGELGAIYGGSVSRLLRFGTDERPVAYGFELSLQVVFQEIKTAGA